MYLGELVEVADKNDLFKSPFHPYTKAFQSALPGKKDRIPSEVRSHHRLILLQDAGSILAAQKNFICAYV